MKFCHVCDNMMYLKLDGAERLQYHCKNCLYVTPASEADTKACVLGKNYVDDETAYRQFVSPHLKHDPTLPRVNNIRCPNEACTRPADAPPLVIFVKYDPLNMRFLYHCCHCETFWKSGQASATATAAADGADGGDAKSGAPQ